MTTAQNAEKNSSANGAKSDSSSMDFVSQMVANGLSSTFESLKEKVTANIKDNGEQYLADAIEKLKTSASDLADWGKKNPIKTAAAVAAVLAVTAFLVTTVKSDGSSMSSNKGKKSSKDEDESSSSSGSSSSGRSGASGSGSNGSSTSGSSSSGSSKGGKSSGAKGKSR